MSSFSDRLAQLVEKRGTPVLVGLDPRWERLPQDLIRDIESGDPVAQAIAVQRFCHGVIDVVAPLVAAVKPQLAFFEQLGPAGMQALADVIRYAHQQGLLVILDGKRNDIGSTAAGYADAYLGATSAWGGDALTVSPYLGEDSLQPFVDVAVQRDAGIFVLVKTSNPGGGDFQDLVADGETVYRRVAHRVEALAAKTASDCGYGAVGAVVGATYPEQLAELRKLMPHAWLLVPGFGAQGAAAADVVDAFDEKGLGAVINASRSIIFAHNRPEFRDRFRHDQWQQAVELATREMIEQLS
jgi:orotidine-5'-phosphate decarboxylase